MDEMIAMLKTARNLKLFACTMVQRAMMPNWIAWPYKTGSDWTLYGRKMMLPVGLPLDRPETKQQCLLQDLLDHRWLRKRGVKCSTGRCLCGVSTACLYLRPRWAGDFPLRFGATATLLKRHHLPIWLKSSKRTNSHASPHPRLPLCAQWRRG